MQTRCVNFNESVTAYFTIGIYILHGKLNMFWNLNFWPKWRKRNSKLSKSQITLIHVNTSKELAINNSGICNCSEISNRFESTSGFMCLKGLMWIVKRGLITGMGSWNLAKLLNWVVFFRSNLYNKNGGCMESILQ